MILKKVGVPLLQLGTPCGGLKWGRRDQACEVQFNLGIRLRSGILWLHPPWKSIMNVLSAALRAAIHRSSWRCARLHPARH